MHILRLVSAYASAGQHHGSCLMLTLKPHRASFILSPPGMLSTNLGS